MFGVLDVAVPLGFAFQGGVLSAQNVSKSFQTCGVVQILLKLT